MAYITRSEDGYKVVNAKTKEESFFSTLNKAVIWAAGKGLAAVHII